MASSAKSQRRMPSPRISIRPASSRRRPDHQLPCDGFEMDAVVADQHGRRNLPGAPGQDEIEGEARFAGAGGPADQHGAIADQHRGGVDARASGVRHGAGSRTTKRAPATVGLALGVDGTGAILRPDAPAMGFDDLFRDRQPQSGILPKALMRPVGVEALEDALQRILANARPVVIDHDFDFRAHAAADDPHLAAGFGKRLRVDQQIGDHLSEPRIMARHREGVGGAAALEADFDARRRCRAGFRWRPRSAW